MSQLADKIKQTVETAVDGATAYVIDPDGQHLQALVISPSFEGVSLVKQHKMVMNALKEAFDTHLHALQLKTFTPEKWETQKGHYAHLINERQ